MKRLLSLRNVYLVALMMVALPACTRDENGNDAGIEGEVSGDFVDLGLSSGTKWKATNEVNSANAFFTYDEAVAAFGNRLPSTEQWMELVNECTWTWTGLGYKVVATNGKSISLPASGYLDCEGNMDEVGDCGNYWTSIPEEQDDAWSFYFGLGEVGINKDSRCHGLSVRLVQ